MTITLSQYATNVVAQELEDVRRRITLEKYNDMAAQVSAACGCPPETARQYVVQAVRMARYQIAKAQMEAQGL